MSTGPGSLGARLAKVSLLWWLILGAGFVLVVVVAAVGGSYLYLTSDKQQITRSVEGFAHAVDRGDQQEMLALLCTEERDALLESGVPEDETGGGRQLQRSVETSGIVVRDDVARAVVDRPDQKPVTVYLKLEGNAWRLCDPERLGWED